MRLSLGVLRRADPGATPGWLTSWSGKVDERQRRGSVVMGNLGDGGSFDSN